MDTRGEAHVRCVAGNIHRVVARQGVRFDSPVHEIREHGPVPDPACVRVCRACQRRARDTGNCPMVFLRHSWQFSVNSMLCFDILHFSA